MSSLHQPSGHLLVSPPFIQGVMESLAWSPQLFVAPSPRSYVFTLLNEVRSPVWQRWVECSEFSVHTRFSESVFNYTRYRAAPLSSLQLPGTSTAHRNAGKRQFKRDGQREQQHCTPRGTKNAIIKAPPYFLHTKRLSFYSTSHKESAHPLGNGFWRALESRFLVLKNEAPCS